MKTNLNPRKLSGLGHARGWAAVAFGPSSLELTTNLAPATTPSSRTRPIGLPFIIECRS